MIKYTKTYIPLQSFYIDQRIDNIKNNKKCIETFFFNLYYYTVTEVLGQFEYD